MHAAKRGLDGKYPEAAICVVHAACKFKFAERCAKTARTFEQMYVQGSIAEVTLGAIECGAQGWGRQSDVRQRLADTRPAAPSRLAP